MKIEIREIDNGFLIDWTIDLWDGGSMWFKTLPLAHAYVKKILSRHKKY